MDHLLRRGASVPPLQNIRVQKQGNPKGFPAIPRQLTMHQTQHRTYLLSKATSVSSIQDPYLSSGRNSQFIPSIGIPVHEGERPDDPCREDHSLRFDPRYVHDLSRCHYSVHSPPHDGGGVRRGGTRHVQHLLGASDLHPDAQLFHPSLVETGQQGRIQEGVRHRHLAVHGHVTGDRAVRFHRRIGTQCGHPP